MRKNLLVATTFATLLLIGAGCSFGGGSSVQIKPVTLTYWRIEDDPAAFQPTIDAYRRAHPNVQVVYREVPAADYERELLEALAVDKGPDMFSIPITWMGAWKSKILPLPKETTIPTQVVNADKKIVTVNQKTPTLSILAMRNAYAEGATEDLIMPVPSETPGAPAIDGIWGIPYSYDTLGLYYNKTLLKKAAIEKPPASWRDIQEMAGRLTVLADDKSIRQSGAALGGSENVLYSADILASIMWQNGAILTDDGGRARFNLYGATREGIYPPGVEALIFYQSFANEGTSGYSWNKSMPLSIDAFVTGRTAFFLGYPSDMARIRERAPSLDFGVAPLPQVDPTRPKSLARYPVEVVSRRTAHPNEAWDFIQFAAAQEQVSAWLSMVKRPTALRALIGSQLTDPDIAPFAGQVLTGRSWYKGKDWPAVEAAFNDMIDARPTVEKPDYLPFVNQAVSVVNSTF